MDPGHYGLLKYDMEVKIGCQEKTRRFFDSFVVYVRNEQTANVHAQPRAASVWEISPLFLCLSAE